MTSTANKSVPDTVDIGVIESHTPYSPPVTPIQKRLCRIWAKVLKVDRIGIHDDFFDLGGGSLHAMAILADLENDFGVKLPLSILIDFPEVALLAPKVQVESEQPLSPLLVRFQAGSDDLAPLFLVHGLLGHIFFAPDFLTGIDPRRPVYGIQARGLATRDAPVESINTAVGEYIEAIESITKGRPFHLGGFCSGTLIAVEIAVTLGKTLEQAPTPLLIDPPVCAWGHNFRDKRFGRIRLAINKLKGLDTKNKNIEGRFFRAKDNLLHWQPELIDPNLRSQIVDVASNMRNLLRYHVLSSWPDSAIILSSRDRGRQISKAHSFWREFSGDRLSIHIVAESHRTIFGEDRHKTMGCVNRMLEKMDLRAEGPAEWMPSSSPN